MGHDDNHRELPALIRGADAGSFARYTLEKRLPHIIRQVMAENALPAEALARLEALAAEINDGVIVALDECPAGDAKEWAELVAPFIGMGWYEVPFLFAEVYFYRRILQATGYFEVAAGEHPDPFRATKGQALLSAEPVAQRLAGELAVVGDKPGCQQGALQRLFLENIWSNRNDLSQLPGDIWTQQGEPAAYIDDLLVDELPALLQWLEGRGRLGRVELVADNCGAELLSDLALGCYLLQAGCATTFTLHLKHAPLFVSDATVADVEQTLKHLCSSDHSEVQAWGEGLRDLIAEGRLQLRDAPFWNRSTPFREMPEDLYAALQASELVILKGDANYRRLVEDRYWPHETPLGKVIDYFPTRCLILRALKSEVLVGLGPAAHNTATLAPGWMTEGRYGLIQFYQQNA